MADEKKLIDSIKKVELGDLKILLVGIVLLAVPAGLLLFFLSQDASEGLSKDSLRHMSGRRSTFNFGTSRKNVPIRGQSGSKAGWFSKETPEMKVDRELEEAMRGVERSSRARVARLGSSNRKGVKSYAAEMDFAITSGNGALEEGRLLDAEKHFEEAYNRSDKNVFLQLHAIAGLCEVYSRMENLKKYEEAFDIYMKVVAQLPPEMGGGDLRASVKNAFLLLKQLKSKASPGKVTKFVLKSDLARSSGVNSSAMKDGLKNALKLFPAKFK